MENKEIPTLETDIFINAQPQHIEQSYIQKKGKARRKNSSPTPGPHGIVCSRPPASLTDLDGMAST